MTTEPTAITRAYQGGQLTTTEASDLMRQYAPGNAELPECRHGIHCGLKVDGRPVCPLCLIERAREPIADSTPLSVEHNEGAWNSPSIA